ncbi:hypothetical protein [Quadrisphaera setariae]|uniref:Uncharacterized protein n=1 Tax=Quadrisphaera setariae TaxID=2593304 RepID=A0A5C8ZF48_9ACTN|nr:hypothetical protein [Quadrisphaera setariae]TXR56467.1 hypothetical protein FMM08_10290 [Quadrisphaera setariae]
MTGLATAALDARLAALGSRGVTEPRAALAEVERAVGRRVLADLVERDHVNRHDVRVLREARRRLAALPH